ncbi:hypothetical protein UA08_01444 [Talaromyces atroroseus]|uniref:Knr4/Smi1-like domain-containing protein n=1 Tax=Talaromyces atroroseus TaxID=1441469 RepID=A0A1Q5QA23_TALAT|nr:hypothetical protein UA08_01444 [Talaromyces atroroseus]OKL62760.1 hypothetical protein UA08_01444 [Talaromyces atroroseus]
MAGFLRGFYSLSALYIDSDHDVAVIASRKALELALLNKVHEACSILEIIAHERSETYHDRPFIRLVSEGVYFMYEGAGLSPPAGLVAEIVFDEENLESLEQELLQRIPYLPEDLTFGKGSTEEDFGKLKTWVQNVESERGSNGGLDATTGHDAMLLSSGLVGLLCIALHLNKFSEADGIMTRIVSRLDANKQSEYLTYIRPAWKQYFLSGWLRDKIGVSDDELKQYAEFVRDTTKQRLQDGRLRASDVFKGRPLVEMLEELDRNTLRFPKLYEEYGYVTDDDDEQTEGQAGGQNAIFTAPKTILRTPATTARIKEVELRLGCSLPEDLKEFYALTNGTRLVVSGPYLGLERPFPKVELLLWEESPDWMSSYQLELLPGARLSASIEWPNIDCGGIAMYENDGQGTKYLWYFQGELLEKAKSTLEKAYSEAAEPGKRVLDNLVKEYHGSWAQLRNLQSCWYQQGWGGPGLNVFHNFRDYLSLVVLESYF